MLWAIIVQESRLSKGLPFDNRYYQNQQKREEYPLQEKGKSKIRIAIVILAALLTISLLSLAGVTLYRHFWGATSVSGAAPNNIITPEEKVSGLGYSENGSAGIVLLSNSDRAGGTITAMPLAATASGASTSDVGVTLSLYAHHAEDNSPFQVKNMFPGDSETNYYCVQVSHKGNVTLRFHADIREGYEKLAEVMKCRIVLPDSGTVLYDGLMRDMPASLNVALSASLSKTSEVSY